MSKKEGSFKFKKQDQIGSAGAEEDEYLEKCYVDTGDLDCLLDTKDHRLIVLGRTGSGKSALLITLAKKRPDQTIEFKPETLALDHIANSTILKFFSNLGVNLDPFYKLLWRHVLTVEVLNHFFSTRDQDKSPSIYDKLRSYFSGNSRNDQNKQEAIDYLENWGKQFWNKTDVRIKEITKRVESNLAGEVEASLGIPLSKAKSTIAGNESLTEEIKMDLYQRGQEIVSGFQVNDLHKIIDLLDEVLSNPQKPYYLIVDGLDENWVEESIRYKLIMGLIDTAKEFNKVKNAKLIVALRRDLIDRVFRVTRESGFQEEKYRSLYLSLTWNKDQILDILNRRLNELVARRYTKNKIGYRDLLPNLYKKVSIDEYIFKIAPRPRDVIEYFNTCISVATDLNKFHTAELKKAEGLYSRSRLRALGDEWSGDYPALIDFTEIFQRSPISFCIEDIEDKKIEDLCLKLMVDFPNARGILLESAKKLIDNLLTTCDFKLMLMQVFYQIGLIGLKLKPHESVCQVGDLGPAISSGEITSNTGVEINSPYRRALGVIDK
jgi:hypothetical protein